MAAFPTHRGLFPLFGIEGACRRPLGRQQRRRPWVSTGTRQPAGSLRRHVERAVELGRHILEGDQASQLDERIVVEVETETLHQCIVHPGQATQVSRTIEVMMTEFHFTPERITVKEGETVRFAVRNGGKVVHEFNIGTAAMHAEHREEMKLMVERGALEVDHINYDRMRMAMGHGHMMTHDDPNSVLLEPGKSATVIWTFDTDAKLQFACNVPGHYASGMMGEIFVRH